MRLCTPDPVTVKEAADAVYKDIKSMVGGRFGKFFAGLAKGLTSIGHPFAEDRAENPELFEDLDAYWNREGFELQYNYNWTIEIIQETIRNFAIGQVTGLGIYFAARKLSGPLMCALGLECFPAGTPVHTEAGVRAIETIKAGDRVWSFDLARAEWVLKVVLETYRREYRGPLYRIGIGESDAIECTDTHPFWVIEGTELQDRPRNRELLRRPVKSEVPGRWVDAHHLQPGDMLLLRAGKTTRILEVTSTDTVVDVYNFRVAETETYAVGLAGVLVHNVNRNAFGPTKKPGTRRYEGPPEPPPDPKEIKRWLDAQRALRYRLHLELEQLGRQAVGQTGSPCRRILIRMAEKAGLRVVSGGEHLKVIDAAGNTITVIPHSPQGRGTIQSIVNAIIGTLPP